MTGLDTLINTGDEGCLSLPLKRDCLFHHLSPYLILFETIPGHSQLRENAGFDTQVVKTLVLSIGLLDIPALAYRFSEFLTGWDEAFLDILSAFTPVAIDLIQILGLTSSHGEAVFLQEGSVFIRGFLLLARFLL